MTHQTRQVSFITPGWGSNFTYFKPEVFKIFQMVMFFGAGEDGEAVGVIFLMVVMVANRVVLVAV